MANTPLALGIDLGTSGVRIAVIDASRSLLFSAATGYRQGLHAPCDWIRALEELIPSIPTPLRRQLGALAVDGTSGTLLACTHQGDPLGDALPYHQACQEQIEHVRDLITEDGPACSSSSSLARALRLLQQHPQPVLLRHQADWLHGWLLQDWRWGEEGNNIRLGWLLQRQCWPESFYGEAWMASLPDIRPSGSPLGTLSRQRSRDLDLPDDLIVVAGTTDANAAVLTADAADDEGITVLGSTLVIKRFMDEPLRPGAGTSTHRVGGRWLGGGASNSGGAVLRQIFPGIDLAELSRQIDPERSSGLDLRPLACRGERFPVDDPTQEPVLTPRPVSDSLYLHGLLEGLSKIERDGWQRLQQLGAPAPKKLVTLGGGARNPQWRRLRERMLGLPIRSCTTPPAAGVARLALTALQQKSPAANHSE